MTTLTHVTVGNVRHINLVAVADETGAFAQAVLPVIEGRLLHLDTQPGAPAPTSGYRIELFQADGIDLLEGVGHGRSATVAETVPVVYSGKNVHPVADDVDQLTIAIGGNAAPGARITAQLYYALGV